MTTNTQGGSSLGRTAGTVTGIDASIAAHDRRISDSGVEIWLGAEPTFTDRNSTSAEWQTAALGLDKEQRAREFVGRLANEQSGSAILRTLGRQYPGEATPRWSFGIYSRRDGQTVWNGPLDPIVESSSSSPPSEKKVTNNPITAPVPAMLRDALKAELESAGLSVSTNLPTDSWGVRLLFAEQSDLLLGDWLNDPDVVRPPVQTQPIPPEGQRDHLAERGVFLVSIDLCDSSLEKDRNCIQVELPEFAAVDQWLLFLETLERAAGKVGLRQLILTGFPPPVDQSVAWTTVTPDPGVLEINMAPCSSVSSFLVEQRRLHAAAKAVGLSAFRLLFNGDVVDSGGGQHLTFGGASSQTSPFLLNPHLLPRLIACLNRHPALSYWFAVRAVGSCGQQPRADEVSRESLDGLSVALSRLFQSPSVEPETLWRSLAPFLCDRFGNTHRCEINIEKLWNPYVSGRGCLGLVELRAFRMTRSPEDAAAVAAFVRTLIAWLEQSESSPEMIEWGPQLHDRFSLPFYLSRDLQQLLAEMREAGFELDESVTSLLTDDSTIVIGECDLGAAKLVVRQGVEFWPVVGDLSAKDESFRLMDSSTSRVEISLKLNSSSSVSSPDSTDWKLSMLERSIPWVVESVAGQTFLLRGVRYKTFQPYMPVAPLVDVLDPLEFFVTSPDGKRSWRIRLFNWRPNGQAYDGQAKDFPDAQQRRNERLVVQQVASVPESEPLRSPALTECCVDLRRLH